MKDSQIKRLQELASKKGLTPAEWKEYEGLVKLQYSTGHNDPIPDPKTKKKKGE